MTTLLRLIPKLWSAHFRALISHDVDEWSTHPFFLDQFPVYRQRVPQSPHTPREGISLNLRTRLKFRGAVCAHCSKRQLCRFRQIREFWTRVCRLHRTVTTAPPWLTELQGHLPGLRYCKISSILGSLTRQSYWARWPIRDQPASDVVQGGSTNMCSLPRSRT